MREPAVTLSRSEAETEALAERLARSLRAGDVVALRGDLGAGKTRFVRGLVRGLGGDPARVSSPTFVLANHYPLPAGAGGPTEFVHIDAYRLRGAEELESVGWDAVVSGDAVVAVEWPERIEPAMPPERFEVLLEHAGVDERRVTVRIPAGRGGDLGA
jgi:tRNA threonylcarbamoyladenosine biosynthesis protein TsaE